MWQDCGQWGMLTQICPRQLQDPRDFREDQWDLAHLLDHFKNQMICNMTVCVEPPLFAIWFFNVFKYFSKPLRNAYFLLLSFVTRFISIIYLSYLNPRESLSCMYKHLCFDVIRKPLTVTNSSSVSRLSQIYALYLGCQRNMVLVFLLRFFGMAEYDCISNNKDNQFW